jgi:hypothetical protein
MDKLPAELNVLAERALKFAQEQFQVELDYSPESVQALEKILQHFSRSIRLRWLLRLLGRGITDEQIWKMAFLWGAYLGMVMQRHLGGEWSLETVMGKEAVVTLTIAGVQTFPINRVHRRLTAGAEDNVWVYYQLERRLASGELKIRTKDEQ